MERKYLHDVAHVKKVGDTLYIASEGEGVVDEKTVVAAGADTPRNLAERFGDVVNVKDFGAVGDGETDDTEAIKKIDRPVYMNGVTVLVDALPNVKVRDNGYWKVKDFYNGLTCLVPASAGTLPHKKTVLNYVPNSTSWAQDSAWYWNGRKGVGYSIGAHTTAGLAIARPWKDASWRAVHQYGSKSHWEQPTLFSAPLEEQLLMGIGMKAVAS